MVEHEDVFKKYKKIVKEFFKYETISARDDEYNQIKKNIIKLSSQLPDDRKKALERIQKKLKFAINEYPIINIFVIDYFMDPGLEDIDSIEAEDVIFTLSIRFLRNIGRADENGKLGYTLSTSIPRASSLLNNKMNFFVKLRSTNRI